MSKKKLEEEKANEIINNKPNLKNDENIINDEEKKENEIINGEPSLKNDENIISNEEVKLRIEVGFNDKYNDAKYIVGDIVSFSKERANELLNDSRNLVSELK